MNLFSGGIIGFFFGFGFGVGCALAVMYSIYIGGYRKAVEDSLHPEKSDRYDHWLKKSRTKLEKERLKKQA